MCARSVLMQINCDFLPMRRFTARRVAFAALRSSEHITRDNESEIPGCMDVGVQIHIQCPSATCGTPSAIPAAIARIGLDVLAWFMIAHPERVDLPYALMSEFANAEKRDPPRLLAWQTGAIDGVTHPNVTDGIYCAAGF